VGGKLVVGDIPFVDDQGVVHRDGVLVMPLTLAGDMTKQPPDHAAHFVGGIPCDSTGAELRKIINSRGGQDLGDELVASCSFSMKPIGKNNFDDYHEKVIKYVAAIAGHAAVLDPAAKATVFRPVVPDDVDEGRFNYIDTASSRSGIGALNERLKNERVAIVGLGGTGEYILDFVAKTPVAQIHPFDGDEFLTHNAFRGPGAPTLAELNEAPLKVDHFYSIYSKMHTGIEPHPYDIDETNADQLRDMTFVFLAIDDAPAKEPIVTALLSFGIPFVDVGMGVEVISDRLIGIVRTTTGTPEKSDHISARVSFATTAFEGEYRSNIQIAELNARNASDAVISWKKYRGVYANLGNEHFTALSVATNHVVNADQLPPADDAIGDGRAA
jgi:hypothetical protein